MMIIDNLISLRDADKKVSKELRGLYSKIDEVKEVKDNIDRKLYTTEMQLAHHSIDLVSSFLSCVLEAGIRAYDEDFLVEAHQELYSLNSKILVKVEEDCLVYKMNSGRKLKVPFNFIKAPDVYMKERIAAVEEERAEAYSEITMLKARIETLEIKYGIR